MQWIIYLQLETHETNNVPLARGQEPLLDSDFVVVARESIPQARQKLTIATTRGRATSATRGRGTANT
jgi:hypothetical protein